MNLHWESTRGKQSPFRVSRRPRGYYNLSSVESRIGSQLKLFHHELIRKNMSSTFFNAIFHIDTGSYQWKSIDVLLLMCNINISNSQGLSQSPKLFIARFSFGYRKAAWKYCLLFYQSNLIEVSLIIHDWQVPGVRAGKSCISQHCLLTLALSKFSVFDAFSISERPWLNFQALKVVAIWYWDLKNQLNHYFFFRLE